MSVTIVRTQLCGSASVDILAQNPGYQTMRELLIVGSVMPHYKQELTGANKLLHYRQFDGDNGKLLPRAIKTAFMNAERPSWCHRSCSFITQNAISFRAQRTLDMPFPAIVIMVPIRMQQFRSQQMPRNTYLYFSRS